MGLVSLAAGQNVELQVQSAHSDYSMCLILFGVYCHVSSCTVCVLYCLVFTVMSVAVLYVSYTVWRLLSCQ